MIELSGCINTDFSHGNAAWDMPQNQSDMITFWEYFLCQGIGAVLD